MQRWDWIDLTLTAVFWVIGIVFARARGLSARAQTGFTAIMFGSALLQILLQKRTIIPGLGAKGSILIPAVALIVLIFILFRKQFLIPYVPLALAVTLVLSVFVFEPGYVVSYSIYAIVCVLLLASWILTLKKTRLPRN